MNRVITFLLALTGALLLGCQSAQKHAADVNSPENRLTLGHVQKEIRIGMSGAQVAEVMGSPNVVSTDEQRREVWIYDKISTTTAYSRSEGGATILVIGGGAAAGAESTSQRTLTVIVKFDDDKKVRDFAYHASSF